MSDKQIQKAGDYSNQLQANTIVQINGIDESRVREIVDEQCNAAITTCIQESKLVAEQRVSDFKTELLGSLFGRQNLIPSLQEPSCVDSLEKAARAATRTNEQRDKKLLAELLVKRFESPADRHIATGVSKAIDIVELLTEEELTGLTVYFAVNQYSPLSQGVREGLTVLDSLFSKIAEGNLPEGEEWIDNLDIHDALRITPFSSLKPLQDYYYESLSGYTTSGLKTGFEEEAEAINLLRNSQIPLDVLVGHELHPGYKRLATRDINDFDHIVITKVANGTLTKSPLTPEQKETLGKIADLCRKGEDADTIKGNLGKMMSEMPHLSKVEDWWKTIPSAPRITAVGRCLANANARRIDPTLPDIG